MKWIAISGTWRITNRQVEGVITFDQAEDLILQLMWVQDANPKAIIGNKKNTVVDKTTYFERNQSVIDASDEIYAFQVNNSEGVGDTIIKAEAKGLPVKKFSYTIN